MAKNNKEVNLTLDELLELFNGGGWFLTGGAGGPFAKDNPLSVGKVSVTNGILMANVGDQGQLVTAVDGFITTQPEPHIIHVKRIFPHRQTARGGGAKIYMPALGVWLKFVNLALKEEDVRAALAREAEAVRKAQAEHQQWLDKLGAVGKVVRDVRVTDDGEVAWIIFTDSSELRIYGGSLELYGMTAEEVQTEKEQTT